MCGESFFCSIDFYLLVLSRESCLNSRAHLGRALPNLLFCKAESAHGGSGGSKQSSYFFLKTTVLLI